MEGFDIGKDWKNADHCRKTKCKKLEKESKEYNKALLNQARRRPATPKSAANAAPENTSESPMTA